MKTILASLVLSASAFTWSQVPVTVPRVSNVNAARVEFMNETSRVSRTLFGGGPGKSAIAPMGGSKITPLLELDLTQLVIVTDSYPGTPTEIRNTFISGSTKLKRVLEQALSRGGMDTRDVQAVSMGAQILGRLKLEMGINQVTVRHWTDSSAVLNGGYASFREREMGPTDTPVATTFDFVYNQRPTQVVLVSGYILGDSYGQKAGLPALTRYFLPRNGFTWAYLSADGLGFFSANLTNGFQTANQDILVGLSSTGAILLDYPTSPTYHTPQESGGVRFMEGRQELTDLPDLKWIKSLRVERPGIFGYCTRIGDEVRVYQKIYSSRILSPKVMGPLRQVGQTVTWALN